MKSQVACQRIDLWIANPCFLTCSTILLFATLPAFVLQHYSWLSCSLLRTFRWLSDLFLQRTTLKLPVEVPRLGRIVLMLPHREAFLQFGVPPMRSICERQSEARGVPSVVVQLPRMTFQSLQLLILQIPRKRRTFQDWHALFHAAGQSSHPHLREPCMSVTTVNTISRARISKKRAATDRRQCSLHVMSKPSCKALRWSTVPFGR